MDRDGFNAVYRDFCVASGRAVPPFPFFVLVGPYPCDMHALFLSVLQLGGWQNIIERRLIHLVMSRLVAGYTTWSADSNNFLLAKQLVDCYQVNLSAFERYFADNIAAYRQKGIMETSRSADSSPPPRLAQVQAGSASRAASPIIRTDQHSDSGLSIDKDGILQRSVSTFGGYDVDLIMELSGGTGEAGTKQVHVACADLQCLNWTTILNCLKSGLKFEIYKALRTLLILSMYSSDGDDDDDDGELYLDFSAHDSVFRALVSLWNPLLSVCVFESERFWALSELFDHDQSMMDNLETGSSHSFTANMNKENMELLLMIGTIFRNATVNTRNAKYAATDESFMNGVWKYAKLSPRTDRPAFHVPQRKNLLSLIQNMSPFIPSIQNQNLHGVISIVADFLDSADEYPSSDNKIRFSNCIPITATLPLYEDDYVLSALDALSHLLENVDVRNQLAVSHPDLMVKCLLNIFRFVPIGSSIPGVNNRQTQGYIDLNKSNLALKCIYRISESQCEAAMLLLAAESIIHRILVRVSIGICWSSVPIYLSDPAFKNSAIYRGVSSIKDPSLTDSETQIITELRSTTQRLAMFTVRNIARFVNNSKEKGEMVVVDRWRKFYVQPMCEIRGSTDNVCSEIVIDLDLETLVIRRESESSERRASIITSKSDFTGFEHMLVGIAMNRKVPTEVSDSAAEILHVISNLDS